MLLSEERKQLLDVLKMRTHKKENKPPGPLGILGKRIDRVDRQIVHLLARRKDLAEAVIRVKLKTGERIYRPDTEKKRLQSVSRCAEEEGLSPEFARALQFLIMIESRNVQVEILEAHRLGEKIPEAFAEQSFEELRSNLIKLTAFWAPRYDNRYGSHSVAAKLHLEFERALIKEEIAELSHHALLVDVGCATGRETLEHKHGFARILGYDVSADMIAVAQAKAAERKLTRTVFQVHDVETGLPLESGSVSFLYLNQGTASDLKNIAQVLEEVARVLKREGRFLLSFYNASALVYRSFLPWPPNLMAEFSPDRHCLDVQYFTEKVEEREEEVVDETTGGTKKIQFKIRREVLQKLPVFARAYTVGEAQQLLPSELVCSGVYTHPTLSAVLPPDIFQEEKVVQLIKHLDKELASSTDRLGAYIVLTGFKT